MIERLERVVPEAPGRPEELPIAKAMQQTAREIAFDPDAWTTERASMISGLFDSLAPDWGQRAEELRRDPLEDAFARGGVPGGLGLELGSGTGIFTPWLAERFETLVAVDISMEMLRRAPAEAPRLCADAARLPLAEGTVEALVLVNCFLFPREADRVLASDGALVWVNTLAERTPIHLSADDVGRALPGEWTGVASDAGWGSWSVLRRC